MLTVPMSADKLTSDFNSQALTAQQVTDIEMLANERILENTVSWAGASQRGHEAR